MVKVFRCNSEDWNYLVDETTTKPPTCERMPIYHYGGSYGDVLREFDQEGWQNEQGDFGAATVVHNVYFSQAVVVTKRGDIFLGGSESS